MKRKKIKVKVTKFYPRIPTGRVEHIDKLWEEAGKYLENYRNRIDEDLKNEFSIIIPIRIKRKLKDIYYPGLITKQEEINRVEQELSKGSKRTYFMLEGDQLKKNSKLEWKGFLYDLGVKAREKAEQEKWTYKEGFKWAADHFYWKKGELSAKQIEKAYDKKFKHY